MCPKRKSEGATVDSFESARFNETKAPSRWAMITARLDCGATFAVSCGLLDQDICPRDFPFISWRSVRVVEILSRSQILLTQIIEGNYRIEVAPGEITVRKAIGRDIIWIERFDLTTPKTAVCVVFQTDYTEPEIDFSELSALGTDRRQEGLRNVASCVRLRGKPAHNWPIISFIHVGCERSVDCRHHTCISSSIERAASASDCIVFVLIILQIVGSKDVHRLVRKLPLRIIRDQSIERRDTSHHLRFFAVLCDELCTILQQLDQRFVLLCIILPDDLRQLIDLLLQLSSLKVQLLCRKHPPAIRR